jgi:hypothetical protein
MAAWEWRVLGVLALGGSFLGLVVGTSVLPAQQGVLARVLMVPFLGLYAWGIWCGLRMLERAPRALLPNAWFWALQVPYLTSPVLGYAFTSGSFLYLTWAPFTSNFGFTWRLGSQFQYSLLEGDKPFVIGINVFAFAMLAWIIRRSHALAYPAAAPAASPPAADVP